MNRLLTYFSNHPLIGLSIVLLLSLLFSAKLAELEIRISAEEMLVQHDEEHRFYDRTRRLFGDEQVILVYMQSQRLLAPEKLAVLKEVIGEIETLPFVDRVESLFTIPWVKTVDGYLDKKPYLEKLPADPGEEERILAEARRNPFIRHVLISPERDVMAIAVIMKPGGDQNDQAITRGLDEAVARLKGFYEPVFAIG
ncbi:MAG TPA: hypothetical protein ENJ98_06105, partial [Thiolapillus brandeum]|nr:hypothetical protein [Thiolapillus brandeum]